MLRGLDMGLGALVSSGTVRWTRPKGGFYGDLPCDTPRGSDPLGRLLRGCFGQAPSVDRCKHELGNHSFRATGITA